jgi:hypothetical protein
MSSNPSITKKRKEKEVTSTWRILKKLADPQLAPPLQVHPSQWKRHSASRRSMHDPSTDTVFQEDGM